MNIGIIGYGKMGKEIFHAFFDRTDYFIRVVCRSGIEDHMNSVKKELDKKLRRKRLTQEAYDKKLDSVLFTDDINELSGCDLVIESIYEDINQKQELFAKVEKVVSEKCIFASNTSSIMPQEIFEKIADKKRCVGLHFFYPVILNEFAEINLLPDTSVETVEKIREHLLCINKKSVVLSGDYSMYINQYISLMISHGIYLMEKYNVDCTDATEIFSGLFPITGLFGIVNSTGLGLLLRCSGNFALERIKPMTEYSDRWAKKQIEDGCSAEPETLFKYMESKHIQKGYTTETAEKMKESMMAFLISESVTATADTGENNLTEAVCQIIGFDGSFKEYYNEYGYDRIYEVMEKHYADTGHSVYRMPEREKFEKCL